MKRLFIAVPLLSLPIPVIYAQTEIKESVDTVPPTYNLDDLTVVGNKKVITSDGAKLTYNIEEDSSVKGTSLLDALRKVPMVNVDAEGNIKINGDSNFKIYLNGKEDPSLTANYKNIFKGMPSDMVVKIEVITEPGAKYDAEGTGGILNIVTIKKNSTDGYYGHIEVSGGNMQNSLNAYVRMKKNRLAMNLNASIADNGFMRMRNESFVESENMTSELMRFQNNNAVQNASFAFDMAGLNISYDLSDRDLLTSNLSLNKTHVKIDDSHMESIIFDSGRNKVSQQDRSLYGTVDMPSLIADLSWQHTFNNEGRKSVLSYQLSTGKNNSDIVMEGISSEGISLFSPYQQNNDCRKNNEHTVQFDLINPFSEGRHSLDAGAKGIWRRNKAVSDQLEGEDVQTAVITTSNSQNLMQIQDVYALYTSYRGTFGNLSATAGLRYEHTRMGIDYRIGELRDFTRRLNDIVPNAALSWNFSMVSNLRLSYQMRISRPNVGQVNPYEFSLTPNIIQKGNPDLSSAKSNKVSMIYSNFGGCIGGNLGIEYTSVENAIQFYSYVAGGKTYNTYANIGHNRNLAFTGLMNWTIMPGMQFMLNGRLSHINLSSKSPDYSNSGWNLNYTGNLSYAMSCGIRLNVYGGQSTKNYELQRHTGGYYYYGIGISREFLNNKSMTVTLSANNFLEKNRRFTSETVTDSYRESASYLSRSWIVALSVGWNFGKKNTAVKKTDSKIINDDKSDVSNSSGQGTL